jgi:DnaJ-class molecular chaperone
MAKGDLYRILGISRDADEAEIRSAYRALARKYHPDMGEGSSGEKFRAIQDAYEILGDPVKRREYNQDQPQTVSISFGHYERPTRPEPIWQNRQAYIHDPGHIDLRQFGFSGSARGTQTSQFDDIWRNLISFLFE